MTKLAIEWDYDPEDDVVRTAESTRFLAAWVNDFGLIEWTCTNPDDFPEIVAILEANEVDE